METIKIGNRGDTVKTLQLLLQKKGYNIVADGIFGNITEDIVMDYQEKNHLNVDGIVGRSTWNSLLDNKDSENRINNTKYILTTKNYFNTPFAKKAIVLHDTNGWVVRKGTKDSPSMNHFHWWASRNKKISTPFSIDYKGNIYQHYDPSMWAYHLGLGRKYHKLDQESIGIELVNEGPLTKEKNENFYWYSGKIAIPYNRINDKPVYIENTWRGYNWFAPYSKEQIDSAFWLVKYLIDKFGIRKNVITDNEYHAELLGGFEGVYSHCNVRIYPAKRNKWDVNPSFPLKELQKYLLK